MGKKRMLICGRSMRCAGIERALLGFLRGVDYAQYDVTLLLARSEGALLTELPPEVKVLAPMKFGEMFFLSERSERAMLNDFRRQYPSSALSILSYRAKARLKPQKRADLVTRLWVTLMKKYCPTFEEEFGISEPFDTVLSFWGERTMFYAAEKVKAGKHYTWIHTDYFRPEREDALFLPYFKRCETVFCVSGRMTEQLTSHFKGEGAYFVTLENMVDKQEVQRLAEEDPKFLFPEGKQLLVTVSRLCRQKGSDRIPEILEHLVKRHYDVVWVLVGSAEEECLAGIKKDAAKRGVSDRLLFAGPRVNPYPFMKRADVFVLPTRAEGKPVNVTEVMALGRPIAVAHYFTASEQLSDYEPCRIAPQDEKGIASAIAALLDGDE